MDRKYKVGGYVKLAKLWERAKDAAVAYHSSYYAEKFRDDADKRLVGVYIDITGNKEIYKRPEMVHLLKDCKNGSVNLIFSQTRAYIAANTCDFCFLLKYLFDLPMRVDIVTDDDDQRIDTILDFDNQRQSLKDLAEKYTSIRRKDYLEWRIRLEHEILGSPAYICILQRKDRQSIAITPCAAEHPMSFKVPDRLLTDGQCRMRINGVQFVQALLEANGLAAGKDYQFKGRYEAEKNAVIISLEKDEREW